jgi:zinc finger protein
LKKIQNLKDGKSYPFTFTIDDPSGNSYIKNPNAPAKDIKLREVKYYRTKE